MSFGAGSFGGFGQPNQQNQQTGGFGGFGANTNTTTTTGGFGTNTNTFGATQNTGAGLFGNTGGGGFGSSTGGFGSTPAGGFGAKPAFGATTSAGGGLFGSTTATAGGTGFGAAGGFGNATNTATSSPFGGGATSLFGGANKPTFGTSPSTGGLFGNTASSTTPGFGGASAGFGATANPGIGTNVGDPPGTASVPFQAYMEKEATTNQQNSFQNILFMDAYKKWSSEELRLADYNQGRRYGNATGTGAFGVGSNFGGFGANNPSTTTGTSGTLFGGTGTTTGGFGAQNNTTTGGFGATGTGGGLFGTKPATTGGLFGGTTTNQPAQTGALFGGASTGGFGSTTATGGFGSTPATNTGSLFSNTASQNKPAGGFGFGAGTQNTTGFGNAGTANAFGSSTTGATTGGGLFGNPGASTGTTAGGGLFGGATQTSATNTGGFGTNTAGGFGTQNQAGGGLFGQAKPATGGLFGSATNATAGTGTTGGGLFGSTSTSAPFGAAAGTQQAGGLFGAKPATTTTGGGLFGGSLSQPAAGTATGGGLFGGLGQTAQNQQQQQQGSLFGGSLGQAHQKPSLFGTAPPTAGGGLFGGQVSTQQQTGGLFGQSSAAPQTQGAGLGGSLFGNSQQGGASLGAPQGLTTSINDTGAYGAPSLFQSLAAQEIQNPGPLATPLSVNKTKTSRRSSILPLYKMNPGSASKFATPQKRGYGFSYSTFGTPNSVSSTASTPGTLSQSLLVGSVGRGLTKSISSSNLRRTYNPEDSILLPGAFSSNSGPRFYGSTGSSKKLVINRDMRSDLFSTPSKVREPSSGDSSSDNLGSLGSSRKLTKRVSFDTTIAKDTVPEGVNGNASAGSGGEPDMGYLRPQPRSANGTGSASSNTGNGGSAALVISPVALGEPEMEQVTGKELAIVHEEESSPVRARCIPDNYRINSKELGSYWMSPSKEEIEQMNRVQRQQVVNFTVGRTNVGQVRFRVPVDLTKINLDSIMDGIVTLIIRSATVYPDVNTKPPVGQGLNVPAEILLLHTCPRSGPDAGSTKMKKHVMRLKSIPDTTFVSYDEKTAAWVFRVEHFTTYGLDDEDEDDETDAEITNLPAPATNNAPSAYYAAVPSTEQPYDDTFEFRRRKHVSVPGAFESSHDMMDNDEEEDDVAAHQSFLSNRSAEMSSLAVVPIETMEHDEEMELGEDGGMYENEGEAPYSLHHHSAAELDNDNSLEDSPFYPSLPAAVQETPAGIMRARLRAIKESNTPLKLQVADGDNWMEMLQKTVSPQKRDRAALKAFGEQGTSEKVWEESTAHFDKKTAASRSRNAHDNRGFATSIDLMNSLFEKAKAPSRQVPETIAPAKGFVKWPYKRPSKAVDEDGANMDQTERAFHDSVKPTWSTDGVCIVADAQGQGDDTSEPALKRIRIFDTIGATLTDDPLESISEHKDVVDVHVIDGVPAISTHRVPHIKSFAEFCDHANRRRSPNASSLSKQLGSYEQSVWDLASVLFDPVEEHASNSVEEADQRRENLAKFWTQIVQDSSSAKFLNQARSPEEKAVLHLASRKVPEACRTLIDSKNFKVATLVSLIGTSDSFKKDMREQVDDWQQGDVLAEFSIPLRAIYSMLAGNVAVCEGKKGGGVENRMNSVVLSARFGLDWKQAFGLRLWYGIAAGEGIEAAVTKYVEDLEQGRVPAPQPWYANQRDLPVSWAGPQREQREDLLFGLLKVAAGLARLEDVLEPENAQPSPFRFRFCWQINQALSAIKDIKSSAKLSTDKADALTTSYASEVVYQNDRLADGGDGAWVHAIWVLLHLSDRTARTHAIQDLLGRHSGSLFNNGAKSNLYDILVDDLQIPAQWIWQAAALYWRNQQNQPLLEAECLLRASAYADAHRIFVKELAPKAIVERNYGEITEMLDKLQPHRQQIRDWSLGGEVYSRFLDLLTLQRGGTLSSSSSGSVSGGGAATRTRGRQQQARDEAEQASAQLIGAVEALASSLPAMYDNTGDALPTEVAAITEMADAIAKETMALANKGRMDLTKISRLPLTEDRRVRYSTDLAFAYYREVMSAH